MNYVNTYLIIKPAAQKSDGLVSHLLLRVLVALLQERQILPIFAQHHVLDVLLHVFVIRLTGISDGKHYLHSLGSCRAQFPTVAEAFALHG